MISNTPVTVNILVIKHVLYWLELHIEEVLSPVSNDDKSYRGFAMICGILQAPELKDFSMMPVQIAEYFGHPEVTKYEVQKATEKHRHCMYIMSEHRIVTEKIITRAVQYINNITKKVYEEQ